MSEKLESTETPKPKEKSAAEKNANGVYGFIDNGPDKPPSPFPGEPMAAIPKSLIAGNPEPPKQEAQPEKIPHIGNLRLKNDDMGELNQDHIYQSIKTGPEENDWTYLPGRKMPKSVLGKETKIPESTSQTESTENKEKTKPGQLACQGKDTKPEE